MDDKLDQVLNELAEVRRELAEIKLNQPMVFAAAQPSFTVSAQAGNNCPSCGIFQQAQAFDPSVPMVLVDPISIPMT